MAESRIAPEQMTGLDQMRAIQAGYAPPPAAAVYLGLEIESVREGEIVFGMPADARFDNGLGMINGGILSALADFATTAAVRTTLQAGEFALTLDLRLTFYKPATFAGGRLQATGTLVHRGKSVGVAECTIRDSRGVTVAGGSATCLVKS